MDSELELALHWLSQANHVAVLTGAGISAESGIPTFRGPDSRWRGCLPEQLASPEAFKHNPRLVWEWYDWRRGLIAGSAPNPGHYALAALEAQLSDFTLITQNVDGLHARAGSQQILCLHGDIWTLACTACGWSGRNESPQIRPLPPSCTCGAILRPGVVWFGESLPSDVWSQALQAAQRAEVFLVVGTSAVVMPAASLASLAQQHGAKVIEVNNQATRLSSQVDVVLRGSASEILPRLAAGLRSKL
ncbi:MAG: NAD-dependent deacylase [Bryobacteraceae bacterium]|nr:NAD-dependent deacylase [Bryobacteraceae bacterium]MDW8379102.1 NAD-dependent deacylase [Bryobacterales bacterium]